jgi:hypothetical protein
MVQWNFTRAKVGRGSFACVAATPDIPEAQEPYHPYASVKRIDYDDPHPNKWFSDDEEQLEMSVAGITRYVEPGETGGIFVVISHNGGVFFNDRPSYNERIAGAGVGTPDSRGWGRVQAIAQVGERLYACGEGGQIHVRRAPGQWEHLTTSILDSAQDRVRAMRADPEGFEAASERRLRALLRGEIIEPLLFDIAGPAEDDIYVCGIAVGHPYQLGRIFHWDGARLADLSLRTVDALTRIHVESRERIWVCGRRGQLLLGNARDGFRPQPGLEGGHLFTGVTMHEGAVYLASAASPRGLFRFMDGRLERVRTGLRPEIEDVFHVEAADGVLWTVGQRDVTRYDGQRWERIDHPDNPPIR